MHGYPALDLYIAGRFEPGEAPCEAYVQDPSNRSTLAPLQFASEGQVARALLAAQAGFEVWRRTSAYDRSRVLERAADLVRERAGSIAGVLVSEQGKVVAEARAEVAMAADVIEWCAEEGRRAYGRIVPGRDPSIRQMVLSEPVGPAVAFTPWNFPALTPARKLGGALAAGCSLILKPSEETPGTAVELVRALHDAGVPPGVLGLLQGPPAELSRRLIASSVIRKVSFTGSTAVGRELFALCAEDLKRITLELGGHAAVVVADDVDPERAAASAAAGKYRNGGQVCVSPTRFYVHEAVRKPFTEHFVAHARALRLGRGDAAEVTMGPLANGRRVDAMERLTADAVACGARLLTGGEREGNAGWFFAPTVLEDVPEHAALMNEEPFGPIAPINGFIDLDDAIARANRLPYGLAAYAYTSSAATGKRLADGLRAGMVGVNTQAISTPETPFGGVKWSGQGQEGGLEGLKAYLDVKLVAQA